MLVKLCICTYVHACGCNNARESEHALHELTLLQLTQVLLQPRLSAKKRAFHTHSNGPSIIFLSLNRIGWAPPLSSASTASFFTWLGVSFERRRDTQGALRGSLRQAFRHISVTLLQASAPFSSQPPTVIYNSNTKSNCLMCMKYKHQNMDRLMYTTLKKG